ncbi:MAG: hypothetical protein WBY71_05360 [Nitrososphaeraceae archaeon]
MVFKVIFSILTMGFLFVLFGTVYNDSGNKDEAYAVLPNILKVKIDSPADGQQVPTGNLQITGNSTDDAQTNCVISVALNRKTPYQTTMATGPAGGGSDYSSWAFSFNSSYAVIEPGQNRIAAKISCPENPALVKGTHINVTGVASGNLSQQTTMAPSQPPTPSFPTPIPAPYAEQRPPSAAPFNIKNMGYLIIH